MVFHVLQKFRAVQLVEDLANFKFKRLYCSQVPTSHDLALFVPTCINNITVNNAQKLDKEISPKPTNTNHQSRFQKILVTKVCRKTRIQDKNM